ncbi:MAG: MBL fold metallo-hydrolase [Acidobacteriaceae bacterium]
MIRETVPVGLLGCNCSILGDEVSREAIVVDPGYEIPCILELLSKHQLTVKTILITHAHIDHIASAISLREITGAPIVYNQQDLPLVAIMSEQAGWIDVPVPNVLPPDHSPADGEVVQAGEIRGTVLYTPGHTEGSLCLYVPDEKLLLAGDTLFAGGVGRTDLQGGNMGKLLASIEERLLTLPDETLVVPGHGPMTTIGEERRNNPFLA